jgi:GNAT superfamily N-acetyltransferase
MPRTRRNASSDVTDSPAFRRWFGKSVVVDEDGAPLVVYHGTSADFETFRSLPQAHLGFHFGTSAAADEKLKGDARRWRDDDKRRGAAPEAIVPEDIRVAERARIRKEESRLTAERYAVEQVIRAREEPVDLEALMKAHGNDVDAAFAEYAVLARKRTPKPTAEEARMLAKIDAEQRRLQDEMAALFSFRRPGERVIPVYLSIQNPLRMKDTNWGDASMIKKDHPHLRLRGRTPAEIRNEVEARGFDGIVYENAVEDVGSLSWIAFHPTQIKSATGNRGTFDAADPDIRHNPRRRNPDLHPALRAADGTRYFSDAALAEADHEGGAYKSRTALVLMDPADFIRMAMPGTRSEATELVGRLMQEGTRFKDVPRLFVSYDEETGVAEVTGHEGRHRSRALLARGVRQMPVRIHTNNLRWSEQSRPSSWDYVKVLPHTLIGEAEHRFYRMPMPVPIHYPELEARMRKQNPRPPVVLYHGTFKPFVPSILKDGLTPATGWGGANTTGVFLSGSPEGARYWGRYAAASNLDLDGDGDADFDGNAERYERRFPSLPHVQVLRVTVPANKVKNLRADMEQAEDVGFEGGAEDWQESLAAIGDVMYAGPVPAAWIEVAQAQPAAALSAKKMSEARIALSAYNTAMRAGDWEVPESVHEAARTLRSKGPETTAADVEPLMAWHREALKQNPRRNPTTTYPSREDIRAAEEKFFPALERLAGEGQTFYSGPFVVVGDRKGGVLGNLEISVGTSSTIEGRTPVVHLSFIGVSPDQRGEGRGTALLNLVAAAADEVGLPVELEVDPQTMRGEKKPPMGKPALRAFYKKAGFGTVRGMGSDFMLRKPRKQNPRRRNPAKKQTFSSKPLTAEEKEKLGRANVFLMDWVCDGYGDLPPRIAEIEALQRALTNVEARELLAWFDRNASGENFSGYR